jgi:Ser/Thr protein kinase RdoA (MazF antagonist)
LFSVALSAALSGDVNGAVNGALGGAPAPAARPAFAGLGPQQVLDALDAAGVRGDGRLLQLNSYENRVFQVMLEEPMATGNTAVVAKFYRPGRWSDAQIVEEHRFALELAAAEVPVVPPLELVGSDPVLRVDEAGATLATWFEPGGGDSAGPWRFAVAERRAGREAPLHRTAVLAQLGRFIGRLHAVGRRGRFAHRLQLRADDGRRAVQALLQADWLTPAERPAWQAAAQEANDAVERAFEAAGDITTLRLHGDCHPGNLLWRADETDADTSDDGAAADTGRAHIVDLDDALQGPAVQDLWMLASGDAASAAAQFDTLLAGYRDFADFDERERALIEPLRTRRMLQHSAWLAARWSDPSFPLNFGFFGSAAYWSQQTRLLREQIELMAG